jgi:hypothetical protein
MPARWPVATPPTMRSNSHACCTAAAAVRIGTHCCSAPHWRSRPALAIARAARAIDDGAAADLLLRLKRFGADEKAREGASA